jgi:hypothetical protein
VYWHSPYGESVGGLTIRAPAATARAWCSSASSTCTSTEPAEPDPAPPSIAIAVDELHAVIRDPEPHGEAEGL